MSFNPIARNTYTSRLKNKIVGTAYITGLKSVSKILNIPKPSIFIGKNSSISLCESAAQFGLNKILIVTDKALYNMGMLDNILKSFEQSGIEYSLFTDVLPDPTFDVVNSGLDQYINDNCDSVLAIGGGSSIDAAKVIALSATNGQKPIELAGLFKGKKPSAPFFTIPTTSGTGSEATIGAVISDSETHNKELVIDTKMVPLLAALDPELTKGLPSAMTAATGVDALTHLVEAYMSEMATEESDNYARSGIQMIFNNLPTVCKKGNSLKAREKMALASYYGGLTINIAGLGYVHAFAHQLGAKYKLPHGLANSIVLPHIIEYNKTVKMDRLAELAQLLGLEAEGDTTEVLADKFIDAVNNLIDNIGIDRHQKTVQAKDIDDIIQVAFKEANSTYAVPKYMSYKDARALLEKL
jgi:alcohol dehydrogenase